MARDSATAPDSTTPTGSPAAGHAATNSPVDNTPANRDTAGAGANPPAAGAKLPNYQGVVGGGFLGLTAAGAQKLRNDLASHDRQNDVKIKERLGRAFQGLDVADMNASPTTITMSDDDSYGVLSRCKIGSAVMLPYILDPQWKVSPVRADHKQMCMLTVDQDGNVNQRPLDRQHVQNIERSMRASVRRTEPGDRLRVSMTADNFESSLIFTVQEIDRAARSDQTIKTYTVESLRQAITDAFFRRGGKLTDFPPLFYCGNDQRPSLDSGQHRREAFLNVVDPKRETTVLTVNNMETYGWVVDISDKAKVDQDYYRVIRGNPVDVYKQGSAGDEYMIAFHAWINLSGAQLSKLRNDTALSVWMESTLRLRAGNIQRLRQLLKDPDWNLRVFRFCKMRWAREKFSIDNWIKVIGTRLPQYWEDYMDRTEKFLRRFLTPEGAIAASVTDLDLIASVYPYEKNGALRVLFYPVSQDVPRTAKELAIDPVWFSGGLKEENKLATPLSFKGQTADIRRPGFLCGLSEKDYAKAYELLQLCPKPFTTLKAFNTHMKDIGLPLAAVCEHIVYWVDPLFVKPASSEPEKLHDLDWMKLMARGLWEDNECDGLSIEQMQDAKDQREKKTAKLVQELVTEIEDQLPLWKKEASIGGLAFDHQALVNRPVNDDVRAQYVRRFHRATWNKVLVTVLAHMDAPKLTGLMAQFGVTPALAGDMLTSVRSLFEPYRAAYHGVVGSRLPYIPYTVGAGLVVKVAKVCDWATLGVEFAHCHRIYHQRLRAKSEGEVAAKAAIPYESANPAIHMTDDEQRALLQNLHELAARLRAYNVVVHPESERGAEPVKMFGELTFDSGKALAGYDVDDYVPPRNFVTTPNRRKRIQQIISDDDEDSGEEEEAQVDVDPFNEEEVGESPTVQAKGRKASAARPKRGGRAKARGGGGQKKQSGSRQPARKRAKKN